VYTRVPLEKGWITSMYALLQRKTCLQQLANAEVWYVDENFGISPP